jgi:hypothetical protein
MKMTALISFVCLLFAVPAHADWSTGYVPGRSIARPYNIPAATDRQWRQSSGHYAIHISGDCWHAARLGGPCGCEASKIAFGRSVRELWLVSNWYRFPRTSPHVGAAAIWGRHHVEIVTAVNGDDTVDTRGSVGWSHVPIKRLRFVEPRGSALL